MRIIGGHDYYDSGMAFGKDNTVVFVRNNDKHPTKKDLKYLKYDRIKIPAFGGYVGGQNITSKYAVDLLGYYNRTDKKTHSIHSFKICKVWIAGSEWNGIYVNSHCGGLNAPTDRYFWTYESFVKFINDIGLELEVDKSTPKYHKNLGRFFSPSISKEWFGEKPSEKSLVNWMIEKHITIITFAVGNDYYKKSDVPELYKIDCDNLKDLEFYKVLDSYTIFQRISQWVGGILSNSGNPMVEITDDKIKVAKHGFDKFSFRKLPE